jgi:hypothetical protein
MIDQLKKQTSTIFNLLALTPETQSHLDENFYEDERQLADEIAAPLPEELENQPQPEIDPDDFEELYTWFLA